MSVKLQVDIFVCGSSRGNSEYYGLSAAGNISLDSVTKLWYMVTIAAVDSITRLLR
jgi:hypothetical protein